MQNSATQQSESVLTTRKPTTVAGSSEMPNTSYSGSKAGIGGGFMLSVTSKWPSSFLCVVTKTNVSNSTCLIKIFDCSKSSKNSTSG